MPNSPLIVNSMFAPLKIVVFVAFSLQHEPRTQGTCRGTGRFADAASARTTVSSILRVQQSVA